MNVRLTSQERDALQRLADRHRRTLSDYIRLVLQDHVKAEDEPDRAAHVRSKRAPE